jgi:CDGSH-type Zn-finger protein
MTGEPGDGNAEESAGEDGDGARDATPVVTIKVRAGGPLKVSGPVRLVDHEGRPFPHSGDDLVLCRCGRSADKPFCDGSHRLARGDESSERQGRDGSPAV